jgi:serine/threonine protein kinase
MLMIGAQIAAGMSHLSAFIVHRDLAARNILLVSTNNTKVPILARVADFGLSRPLNNHGYMRVSTRHAIPVPWTANEVLAGDPHTPAADVWSFGVVLWEMFMGCPDVPPRPNRQQVPPLPQPQRCPDDVYALMTRCWAMVPTARPTFEALHSQLIQLHSAI